MFPAKATNNGKARASTWLVHGWKVMKRAECALFAAGLICALSLVTIGQKIVIDVNLTMLTVRVQDEAGQPVLDLTADDFEILENGH
jgi:hypothetical protein